MDHSDEKEEEDWDTVHLVEYSLLHDVEEELAGLELES